MRLPPCATKRLRNGGAPCLNNCSAERCRVGHRPGGCGAYAGRGLWRFRPCGLAGASVHSAAGDIVSSAQCLVCHSPCPRARKAAVLGARGACRPSRGTLHSAGDCRGVGPLGGVRTVRPVESPDTGPAWSARGADLRVARCSAGACVFQSAIGHPPDPARLAGDPCRTVPPCRHAWSWSERHVAGYRKTALAADRSGCVCGDLRDLPVVICRRVDAWGRSACDNAGTGDLPIHAV